MSRNILRHALLGPERFFFSSEGKKQNIPWNYFFPPEEKIKVGLSKSKGTQTATNKLKRIVNKISNRQKMNEEKKQTKSGLGHPADKKTFLPVLAIIESNTLAAMGLKQLLETAMPFASVKAFGTFGEFEANKPEQYMHYFVSMQIVLAIVLTPSNDPKSQLNNFHCISVCVSESMLIKELLSLQQQGHPHGEHLPKMDEKNDEKKLSDRETEVLALVAKGKINKEIADQLCIGLTTVITHRKKIQEKLGLKSVAALTIYAVTHGLVDINHI